MGTGAALRGQPVLLDGDRDSLCCWTEAGSEGRSAAGVVASTCCRLCHRHWESDFKSQTYSPVTQEVQLGKYKGNACSRGQTPEAGDQEKMSGWLLLAFLLV